MDLVKTIQINLKDKVWAHIFYIYSIKFKGLNLSTKLRYKFYLFLKTCKANNPFKCMGFYLMTPNGVTYVSGHNTSSLTFHLEYFGQMNLWFR